ncbi:MAG TPA: DUF4124 domain-containing protein [Cellvibrio sp.]|nr:DUF4124 domain-containing protein [Cellvibrio sp.]
MKRLFVFALCMVSLTLASHVFAAKVYKWVDENGVTHFSEHPPKNTQTEVIKPKTGHSEPVNYESAAPTNNADAAATAQQQAEEDVARALKDPTRCAVARKNMETLQNFGRVKVKGEDGSFHYLTPEEQQERIRSTQQAIDESC